ncbi:toxin-antitoxin system HicB family antitoxin, partial [Mycobacterium lacus]|uniref:toxin-antitoxin system HicB family antitoxin n=1 Tax=Mycobacterium lacus TaxID=169765 RepID=UPI003B8A73F8
VHIPSRPAPGEFRDGSPGELRDGRQRTSPALHLRLAVEAAEQHVSMNQWVVQKLSGRSERRLDSLFDFD